MTPNELVEIYSNRPDPPSIRGIADFDWSSVKDAYGSASRVPAHLRALVSDDRDHREFALTMLCQTIWHQGSIYEATALVIPFLYRLLEDNETPNKSNIIDLIATLADGYLFHEEIDTAWKNFHANVEIQDTELARRMGYIDAARRAVAEGVDTLYTYLYDPNPQTRRTIAATLGMLPEHCSRSILKLRTAVQSEPDEIARELMYEAMERLSFSVSEDESHPITNNQEQYSGSDS